jgi:hypothetical protein
MRLEEVLMRAVFLEVGGTKQVKLGLWAVVAGCRINTIVIKKIT